MADTGAQVYVGNLTLFDLLGIPREEFHVRTRDASHMKVHGINGKNISNLRAMDMMIYSLKTRKKVPVTFLISEDLGCNILSEALVYDLGYLPATAFQENFLCKYDGQDVDETQASFMNQAGQLMFGTEHIASANINNARITKGNINSGAKRNLSAKLKDHCANTQTMYKFGNISCQ